MTEQEENALICEKLLGWKRRKHAGSTWWELPQPCGEYAPSQFEPLAFRTWAEAGLILDAVQRKCFYVLGHSTHLWCKLVLEPSADWSKGYHPDSMPLAIRAAALQCARTLP